MPFLLPAFIAVLGVVVAEPRAQYSQEFSHPERVEVAGYIGDVMEPFLSLDGRYLFFNNLNEPQANTDLFYATKVNDLRFEFKGRISGVNSPALDAVASMDCHSNFYFVSTRDYSQSLSTIYRGHFSDGTVSNPQIVPGVSRRVAGIVDFDAAIDSSGNALYFVEGKFGASGLQSSKIYVSNRVGAGFALSPKSEDLLAKVNSGILQYAPCVSADGLTLLFTRYMPGAADGPNIYICHRTSSNAAFNSPLELEAATGFVEAPAFSADEKSIYFHKKAGGRFVLYRMSKT